MTLPLMLIATGWGAMVLSLAWWFRPRSSRVVQLAARPAPLAAPAAPKPGTRPWRRAGVVGLVGTLMSPLLGLAGAVAVLLFPILGLRRANRARNAALVRELPETIDLLRLAVSAGGAMHGAVHAVGRVRRGPATEAFGEVSAAVARGMRLVDALEFHIALFGVPGHALITAIVSAERYGTPIVPTLDRLGAEARDVRRRHGEMVARRVPVRMLMPLVLCVLPAFILVTLVPTLAGSFNSLNFGGT